MGNERGREVEKSPLRDANSARELAFLVLAPSLIQKMPGPVMCLVRGFYGEITMIQQGWGETPLTGRKPAYERPRCGQLQGKLDPEFGVLR